MLSRGFFVSLQLPPRTTTTTTHPHAFFSHSFSSFLTASLLFSQLLFFSQSFSSSQLLLFTASSLFSQQSAAPPALQPYAYQYSHAEMLPSADAQIQMLSSLKRVDDEIEQKLAAVRLVCSVGVQRWCEALVR